MSPLYTFDDLISRERLAAGFDQPAKLAVIGHPVAHSSSPRMHQPALDALGIDARYVKIDVAPGQVAEAFARSSTRWRPAPTCTPLPGRSAR